MLELRSLAGFLAVTLLLTAPAGARMVTVPFDFSRHQIGLDVQVHGTPLYMFLDTGNSPSAIDTARAKSLGLKIDFAHGGEASGQGDAVHMMVYPTSIDGLTIGGEHFDAVEALAADHAAISKAYGRAVDGTLGHSFFLGRVVLIDYPAHTLTISDNAADVAPQLAACRAWRMPLKSFKGDTIPIVEMGIGEAKLPVSIDTGSDSVVELFQHALDMPAVKAALVEDGSSISTGARGAYSVKLYRLNAPLSLGPFVLAAGQRVMVTGDAGTADTRLANVGNRLLEGLKIKLLLDYRNNEIGFFGCAQ